MDYYISMIRLSQNKQKISMLEAIESSLLTSLKDV